ncbi:expressed unknown protein [Seminavis robusta]|uniref:Uncharacterized protein n=1 Tax=Seminavis robusta TaxID=568900 RepID=A0A9N8DWT0_9STRA|nr:expressed unknown protein [Seminavis robusta]|eukprot:Sro340_g121220.1 n/a (103) ;mRNA; f:31012-31320
MLGAIFQRIEGGNKPASQFHRAPEGAAPRSSSKEHWKMAPLVPGVVDWKDPFQLTPTGITHIADVIHATLMPGSYIIVMRQSGSDVDVQPILKPPRDILKYT